MLPLWARLMLLPKYPLHCLIPKKRLRGLPVDARLVCDAKAGIEPGAIDTGLLGVVCCHDELGVVYIDRTLRLVGIGTDIVLS